MIWFYLTIAFLVIAIIGFIGVQKTGNYENKWGYMLIWGGGATIASIVIKSVTILIALIYYSGL
jgi:hypothetical protein